MYSNKNHQYKSNKIWLSGYFPTVSLTASLRCRASLAGLHGFSHSRIFELHCNLGRVGQASLLINLSLISSDKSLFSTDSPDFPGHFSASCFPSRCLVIVMLWVAPPPPKSISFQTNDIFTIPERSYGLFTLLQAGFVAHRRRGS